MKLHRHTLVVEVESIVDRGSRQMQARLSRWLASYGHTAASFGFEFKSVNLPTNPKEPTDASSE